MSKICQATFLRALNISIAVVAGRIVLFAILVTYIFQGNKLNAHVVFVVMSYVYQVRHTLTWLFPNVVALFSEIAVSSKRIQKFLMLEEINQEIGNEENNLMVKYNRIKKLSPNQEAEIMLKEVSVRWTSVRFLLTNNINYYSHNNICHLNH